MKLFARQPKVACPRCKTLHDINPENICPVCGTRYKLPPEALKSADKEQISLVKGVASSISSKCSALSQSIKNMKQKTKRLIRLFSSLFAAIILFLVVIIFCFSDKEPLIFNTGKLSNQPLFYYTTDNTLNCLFPNGKNVEIGTGVLREYSSSNDGRNVYLTFSGEFELDHTSYAGPTASNHLLLIENFEKVRYIYDNPDAIPQILCGGNNEYLYILNNLGSDSVFCELALIKKDGEPLNISNGVKEVAISPNGHYALFSIDDNGASKLLKYNTRTGETENPGIKNATPLSVDNKGEYLIYAKKDSANTMSIVAEKSTSERVEIPVITDTKLCRVIFSQDRRSLAIEYSDRTTFYTCGSDTYSTVLTYNGSVFGYDADENANYNISTLSEIPEICNTFGQNLLPYYFFDKERQGVYCIEKDGAKMPVFDRTFEEIKISENGCVAFVSEGILYSGKLSVKSPDLCEIMVLGDMTLRDISSNGKHIYLSDLDGNLFSVRYGKKNDTPVKVFVDPDVISFSKNGKRLLVVSDRLLSVISGDKVKAICDGIIPEYTVKIDDNFSHIIYAKSEYNDGEQTDELGLYIYKNGKSKLVTKAFKAMLNKESDRIDITASHYTDTKDNEAQSNEEE